MVYRRLYKIAMQYINTIAEEMLDSMYNVSNDIKYWFTLDGRRFTNKHKAIEHNIECLLEEVTED